MGRLKRRVMGSAGVVLLLLVLGFIFFATSVMRKPGPVIAQADGIVVLTGGDTRILEGARLLKEGRGRRMLISGVNKSTGRQDLIKLSGLTPKQFDCCVDVGYLARDTVGNADETRQWAESQGFKSLIVVTASYHMPRSLAELARVLPDTELFPHPVMAPSLRPNAWWLHARTTRVLIAEYIKYLPAAARLAVSRVLGNWETSSIAAGPASYKAKT